MILFGLYLYSEHNACADVPVKALCVSQCHWSVYRYHLIDVIPFSFPWATVSQCGRAWEAVLETLFKSPDQSTVSWSGLLWTVFSWALNTSKEGRSPASLDNLFPIIPVIFFLIFNKNLQYFSLRPLTLGLSLGTTTRIMSLSSIYLLVFLCIRMHCSWACSSWPSIINHFSWNSAPCPYHEGFFQLAPWTEQFLLLNCRVMFLSGLVPSLSGAWRAPFPSSIWLIIPDISVLPKGSRLCLCIQNSWLLLVGILWLTCCCHLGHAASPAGFTEKFLSCCPTSSALCTPSSAAEKVQLHFIWCLKNNCFIWLVVIMQTDF